MGVMDLTGAADAGGAIGGIIESIIKVPKQLFMMFSKAIYKFLYNLDETVLYIIYFVFFTTLILFIIYTWFNREEYKSRYHFVPKWKG